MRSAGRTWLITAGVVLGLLVVSLAAVSLPLAPFRAGAVLLAELVHVAAALVAGSLVLRWARSEPEGLLGRLVFGISLGLALLSLVTLLVAGLGLTHRVTPWLVDLLVFLLGVGQLRQLAGEAEDAWVRLDLSFVMASRIPLLSGLAVVSLLHLAPPFLPSGPETGAEQQALAAQAAVRGDLRSALAARPSEPLRPTDGLLLHGRLAIGEPGARLHASLLAALLTAGAFLHARRRLGGQAAGWIGICLASSPALLLLNLADPSSCWVALHGFLCFAQLSDWASRPGPGKLGLACVHGGLCASESAAGLAAFIGVLLFTTLTEALVERQSALRLLPGVAGLLLIAAATTLPVIALDTWLQPGSPITRAEARWLDPETPATAEGWAIAGAGLRGPEATSPQSGLRSLGALGPLILGLLLLLPLAAESPEPLRHAVLMLSIAVLGWLLPPPWGSGALVLPLAAFCAGASARAVLALGGLASRLALVLIAIAAPVTLLSSLNAGPDPFTGAAVVTGGTTRSEARSRLVPDHALTTVASSTATEKQDLVLLMGPLTDCQYDVRTTRWPAASRLSDPEQLALALQSAGITHAAVDHSSPTVPAREHFSALLRVDPLGDTSPFALYSVERPVTSGEGESGEEPDREGLEPDLP